MKTATTSSSSEKSRFLLNRNFALLWGGQSVSNLGDYMFNTTLVLWIATIIAPGQSWTPIAVSGVLLAASLPAFIVGPLAGVFVDRWDKRRTMLRMDAIRAVLIAILILATGVLPLPFFAGGRPTVAFQLVMIYGVVLLASICAQFFNPSRGVLIADIVPQKDQARASGLSQTTANLAIIIGPPLAAPLIFVVGVQWALIINALSFVVSYITIRAIRVPQAEKQAEEGAEEQGNFLKEFGAGINFYVKNHVLATILISTCILSLGTGALNALDVFFVTQNLHASPELYGTLGMAFGAGSIVGAIISAIFIQRIGEVRAFWSGLALCGLLILILARLTSIWPVLVVFFLFGFPVAAVNVVIGPLVLRITPHHLLGRVFAVFSPTVNLIAMVSIALAGSLASAMHNFHTTVLGVSFGPIDTIFTVAGLLFGLAGLYVLLNMRGLAQPEEEEETLAQIAEAGQVVGYMDVSGEEEGTSNS